METESCSGELSLLNIQKALGSQLRKRLSFEKSGSSLHKQTGPVEAPAYGFSLPEADAPPADRKSERQNVRASERPQGRSCVSCAPYVIHLAATSRGRLIVSRQEGPVRYGKVF